MATAAIAPRRRRRKRMGSRTTSPSPQILLSAHEAGRPLLGERGEPLLRVLGGEEVAELLRLSFESVRREVEEPLLDPKGARALGRELPCDLERMVENRVRDGVHESDPERLLGVHLAPG